jgi:hypothetical protein
MEPHQIGPYGWECPAVGKNNVTRRTVYQTKHACGHCLKFLLDENGFTMSFTYQDWQDMMKKEGVWKEKGDAIEWAPLNTTNY